MNIYFFMFLKLLGRYSFSNHLREQNILVGIHLVIIYVNKTSVKFCSVQTIVA